MKGSSLNKDNFIVRVQTRPFVDQHLNGEIAMKGMKGLVLATATAALLTSGFAATAATADTAKVKCMGANECKGHGGCKSTNNACKGQNMCKGKGWIMEKSDEACIKAGGHIMTKEDEAKS